MKFYQINQGLARKESNDEKLHWWWAFLIVACYGLIFGLNFIAFYHLPEPINDSTNNEAFIASRAKQDLKEFVEIGPKVVGGVANEQLTVMFLLKKLKEIESESKGLYNFEIDTQVASGGFVRSTFINIYDKIQNVVVKITPKNSSSTDALLVNSHFDTVPDSPGAGDAGCMVAIMLGVLSTLTKSKDILRNPVVFLFNGAEENGLQGSHAFITQHRWASQIRAFVNLDATGTGGKEILFQTGPNNAWLVDYYSKSAKHPYASVIGEELFENELIPSDTDFRIFRDYGNLAGLDFAYAYNDYVYHTKYDDIDVIDDGTYQHTGDNVLAIVRALADSAELTNKEERSGGKAVFFDVFGLFMVSYTKEIADIVNIVLVVITVGTVCLSMWLMQRAAAVSTAEFERQFGLIVLVHFVSLILAIGVILFIAFFVDAINYSLSWYSEPWLIFGLYYIPFFLIMGIFPALFLEWKRFNSLPLRFRITMFLNANCLIMVIIAIILIAISIRAVFILTNILLFYTISTLMNLGTRWYLKYRLWILPILIGQAIPFAFLSYILITTYSLFIPITGRSGSANNPEFIIALFSIVYAYFMFGFIIPIFYLFRKFKTMLLVLLAVMLVFVILMFTSVCFPYREKVSPQRQAAMHTRRIMYNFEGNVRLDDAGFYVITWDRQTASTVKDVMKRLNLQDRDAGRDCGRELFCGLPLYHPVMIAYLSTGFWIDASPPNLQTIPSIKLTSKQNIGENYQYTFEMLGMKQNEILIKTEPGVRLTGWSFTTTNNPDFTKEEHFIHQRFGLERLPYTFFLNLQLRNSSAPAVKIAHIGHYQDDDNEKTEEFVEFLREFPDWTFTQGVEAIYQSWQF